MVLVAKAVAPTWKVTRSKSGALVNLAKMNGFVKHYNFQISGPEWGDLVVKMSGHPPFSAQVILNGHNYVERRAAQEDYRRRIARQLDQSENLHSWRRDLAYANKGALCQSHHEELAEQTWCLTIATNAVVTWTTEYYRLAVTALRSTGRRIDDELFAHIWPSHHENVNFYGTHSVDVEREQGN
jgi:hypothetical protein